MIERVLLSTIHASHPQMGMLEAFRERFGVHNVYDFDAHQMCRDGVNPHVINEMFVKTAVDFRPDWVWLQVQQSGLLSPESVTRIRGYLKAVVTHWNGDWRAVPGDYLASFCRTTNFTFISNQGQCDLFGRLAGDRAKVAYVQIGLDRTWDVDGRPDWTPHFRVPDVVFCGGYYGEASFPGTAERVQSVRTLTAAGLDVGVVSEQGWPAPCRVIGSCHVKQQHHVWKRAKVCLNINHENGTELYYSDRQLISMASGRPVVCRHVPGLETEFRDGEHCLFFRNQDELVQKVRWLLANPAEADRIGQAGREHVVKYHQWSNRIEQMLPVIERLKAAL